MRSKHGRGLDTLALLLLATIVVSACGGKAQSVGPPNQSQFAVYMADAFCSALRSCCETRAYAYDDAACTASVLRDYEEPMVGVKLGSVDYDADAAVDCARALHEREARCEESIPSTRRAAMLRGWRGFPIRWQWLLDANVAKACWRALRGKLEPGTPCVDDFSCATPDETYLGACNLPSSDATHDPGVPICFQYRIGAVGDGCGSAPSDTSVLTDCGDDAVCDSGIGRTGKCVPFAAIGERCEFAGGVPCDERSAFCAPVDSGLAVWKCAPLLGLDESCNPAIFSQLHSGGCSQGLFCDESAKTCKPAGAEGDRCTSSYECLSNDCLTTGFTDDAGVTSRGRCGPGWHEATYVSPRSCGFGPAADRRIPNDAGIRAR